jgi:tRNA A-37 threonylcarbamoyl transferase component Bud32
VAAESGQAWVYRVRRSDVQGIFALKRLKNTKRRARFEREVQTMDRLASSGLPVPAIVASDLTTDRPWFVMPWYDAGSLQEIIESGDVPHEERLHLVHAVAVALASLHAAGVAHRDIKPANVLRDGDRVLLADFGLCLAIDADDRLTETEEAVGSRLYIAPENESGFSEDVDQRPADCYAWAKLAWATIAGRNPPARERQLLPENRLEVLLDDPRLVGLHPLFDRMLDPDPRVRLADWQVIQGEIDAVLRLYEPEASRAEVKSSIDLSSALAAAARFAARQEAQQARRDRERTERQQRQATEVVGALSRRIHDLLGEDFRRLDEAAGTEVWYQLSSGGEQFGRLLEFDLLHEWRSKDIAAFSLNEGSPVLAVMFCTADIPNKSNLYVGSFVIVADRSLWLVRVPMMYRPGPQLDGPVMIPDFLRWIYASEGPLPLGLASAEAAVLDFADVTAEVVKATAIRYMELLAEGSDVFAAESWMNVETSTGGDSGPSSS